MDNLRETEPPMMKDRQLYEARMKAMHRDPDERLVWDIDQANRQREEERRAEEEFRTMKATSTRGGRAGT